MPEQAGQEGLIDSIQLRIDASQADLSGIQRAEDRLRALAGAIDSLNAKLNGLTSLSAFKRSAAGISSIIKETQSALGRGANIGNISKRLGLDATQLADFREFIQLRREEAQLALRSTQGKINEAGRTSRAARPLLDEERKLQTQLSDLRAAFAVKDSARFQAGEVRNVEAATRLYKAYYADLLKNAREPAAAIQKIFGAGEPIAPPAPAASKPAAAEATISAQHIEATVGPGHIPVTIPAHQVEATAATPGAGHAPAPAPAVAQHSPEDIRTAISKLKKSVLTRSGIASALGYEPEAVETAFTTHQQHLGEILQRAQSRRDELIQEREGAPERDARARAAFTRDITEQENLIARTEHGLKRLQTAFVGAQGKVASVPKAVEAFLAIQSRLQRAVPKPGANAAPEISEANVRGAIQGQGRQATRGSLATALGFEPAEVEAAFVAHQRRLNQILDQSNEKRAELIRQREALPARASRARQTISKEVTEQDKKITETRETLNRLKTAFSGPQARVASVPKTVEAFLGIKPHLPAASTPAAAAPAATGSVQLPVPPARVHAEVAPGEIPATDHPLPVTVPAARIHAELGPGQVPLVVPADRLTATAPPHAAAPVQAPVAAPAPATPAVAHPPAAGPGVAAEIAELENLVEAQIRRARQLRGSNFRTAASRTETEVEQTTQRLQTLRAQHPQLPASSVRFPAAPGTLATDSPEVVRLRNEVHDRQAELAQLRSAGSRRARATEDAQTHLAAATQRLEAARTPAPVSVSPARVHAELAPGPQVPLPVPAARVAATPATAATAGPPVPPPVAPIPPAAPPAIQHAAPVSAAAPAGTPAAVPLGESPDVVRLRREVQELERIVNHRQEVLTRLRTQGHFGAPAAAAGRRLGESRVQLFEKRAELQAAAVQAAPPAPLPVPPARVHAELTPGPEVQLPVPPARVAPVVPSAPTAVAPTAPPSAATPVTAAGVQELSTAEAALVTAAQAATAQLIAQTHAVQSKTASVAALVLQLEAAAAAEGRLGVAAQGATHHIGAATAGTTAAGRAAAAASGAGSAASPASEILPPHPGGFLATRTQTEVPGEIEKFTKKFLKGSQEITSYYKDAGDSQEELKRVTTTQFDAERQVRQRLKNLQQQRGALKSANAAGDTPAAAAARTQITALENELSNDPPRIIQKIIREDLRAVSQFKKILNQADKRSQKAADDLSRVRQGEALGVLGHGRAAAAQSAAEGSGFIFAPAPTEGTRIGPRGVVTTRTHTGKKIANNQVETVKIRYEFENGREVGAQFDHVKKRIKELDTLRVDAAARRAAAAQRFQEADLTPRERRELTARKLPPGRLNDELDTREASTRASVAAAKRSNAATQIRKQRSDERDQLKTRLAALPETEQSRIKGMGLGLTALEKELRNTERTLASLAKTSGSAGRNFLQNIAHVTTWAASVGVLYGALGLLGRGLGAVINIGGQMARLDQVFRKVGGGTADLADDILQLAAANGRSTQEALESAVQWSRLGLSRAQVNLAVATSLKAANVAEITAAEATQALSGVMQAYGLNVSQLVTVLAQLNSISNHYNVSNKDLLTGLGRTAAIAKQAGLSLEELQGIIGGTVGATGQTGANIGNAIKSTIAALSNPALQNQLRDSFNIEVTASGGADIKSFSDILAGLFIRYQELTDAERQHLVVSVAGKTQANRLAAILDNYVQSMALAIQAQHDLNSAETENAKIKATLKSNLAGLVSEFERFANVQASQGASTIGVSLQTGLRDAAAALKNFLTLLNAPGFRTAVTVLTGLMAVLAARTALTFFQMAAEAKKGGIVMRSIAALTNAFSNIGATMDDSVRRFAATSAASGGLSARLGALALRGLALQESLSAFGQSARSAAIASTASGMAARAMGYGIGAAASAASLAVRAVTGLGVALRSLGPLLLIFGAAWAGAKIFNAAMERNGASIDSTTAKLAGFNAEVEKFNQIAVASTQASHLIQTVQKSINSIRPQAKAEKALEIVASISYQDEPNELIAERRRKLRADELKDALRSGDVARLNTLLEEQSNEAILQGARARQSAFGEQQKAAAGIEAELSQLRVKRDENPDGLFSDQIKDNIRELEKQKAETRNKMLSAPEDEDTTRDEVIAQETKTLSLLERQKQALESIADIYSSLPTRTPVQKAIVEQARVEQQLVEAKKEKQQLADESGRLSSRQVDAEGKIKELDTRKNRVNERISTVNQRLAPVRQTREELARARKELAEIEQSKTLSPERKLSEGQKVKDRIIGLEAKEANEAADNIERLTGELKNLDAQIESLQTKRASPIPGALVPWLPHRNSNPNNLESLKNPAALADLDQNIKVTTEKRDKVSQELQTRVSRPTSVQEDEKLVELLNHRLDLLAAERATINGTIELEKKRIELQQKGIDEKIKGLEIEKAKLSPDYILKAQQQTVIRDTTERARFEIEPFNVGESEGEKALNRLAALRRKTQEQFSRADVLRTRTEAEDPGRQDYFSAAARATQFAIEHENTLLELQRRRMEVERDITQFKIDQNREAQRAILLGKPSDILQAAAAFRLTGGGQQGKISAPQFLTFSPQMREWVNRFDPRFDSRMMEMRREQQVLGPPLTDRQMNKELNRFTVPYGELVKSIGPNLGNLDAANRAALEFATSMASANAGLGQFNGLLPGIVVGLVGLANILPRLAAFNAGVSYDVPAPAQATGWNTAGQSAVK